MNYIRIDNFYSEEDVSLIWEELKFLTYSHKLNPPQLYILNTDK
jgi:hypothetical protein